MHIEVLVEDSSGAKLVATLLPRIIGLEGDPHTWRIHPYKGIGHLPKGLATKTDPAKRAMLDQLPRLLNGYGKTPGIDAVVVVLDADNRNCQSFLAEMKAVLKKCDPAPKTLFQLAVEEIEAWLLGDRQALMTAYPKAKKEVLANYEQDSICGTWELMADAIYPGGQAAIQKMGWPLPGQVKHLWVEKITPHMDVEHNASPSFCKFRDEIRQIALSGN